MKWSHSSTLSKNKTDQILDEMITQFRTLPKSKLKGLPELVVVSWFCPDFLAETMNLGFLNDNLGWGVVERRNEFEVRVGAIGYEFLFYFFWKK